MTLETELAKIKKGQLNNLYTVVGQEKHLISKIKQCFVETVLSKEEGEFNYIQMDMETTPVSAAVEEALTAPFFGEKKLLMIENAFFLSGEKSKTEVEHDLKWLEEYIDSPSKETIAVFIAPYEKLDQRKTLVKKLKKKSVFLSAGTMDRHDIAGYLKKELNIAGYQIESEAFEKLLRLSGTNLTFALKEMDKLMLYSFDNKTITVSMVETLSSKGLDENVFELVDLILNKKTSDSLRLFQSLLDQKEEPIKITALLLAQFRLLLQVKILREKGYQQGDIAGFLKVHPYRVKLAFKQEKKFHMETLSAAFRGLIDVDYQLKTGQGIPAMQFELFVLNFAASGSKRMLS